MGEFFEHIHNEEAKEEAKWRELRNEYLENKTVWK